MEKTQCNTCKEFFDTSKSNVAREEFHHGMCETCGRASDEYKKYGETKGNAYSKELARQVFSSCYGIEGRLRELVETLYKSEQNQRARYSRKSIKKIMFEYLKEDLKN